MDIYIYLFIFLLLGVFIRPEKQNLYFVFSFSFLFILSAFRDISVGTDTLSYQIIFDRVGSGYLEITQEIGWYYLNKIVILLRGDDFQSLLIASTLITLLPIFYIVKKYSLNPMLSIFLYYSFYIYLQSFNITRQVLAVSIFVLSLPFLFKGKNKLYILGVIFAALFHTTALLTLPLIFIRKIPYNKIWWSIIVLLSLIFGVLLSSILIPFITKLLGYEHYLYLNDSDESITGVFLLLTNLFSILIILTSSKDSFLLRLFFAYIIFHNITLGVPYAYRLVLFFSVVQILFLPYYVYNNKLMHRNIALLLVIGYATVFFIRVYGGAGVIPYKIVL